MKIKIALLDNDSNYLSRIVSAFNTKYSDKLETYSFTNMDSALDALNNVKIDVLISNESFPIDFDKIPNRCGFAYFVDSSGIEEINNQRAICKYQKADMIYKQILNAYSEKAATLTKKKNLDSNVNTYLFTSFSGGVGTSSIAASFALYLAKNSKKVLYLNLEKFGDAELFFKAEGQFTLGDVIYALKSKKANVSMKMESAVKTTIEGVCYFAAPKMALDMMGFNIEEIKEMLDTLVNVANYEYIILDYNNPFDEVGKELWKIADQVVIVSDGSENANSKFERAYRSIEIINKKNENDYEMGKIKLIYNKFSSKYNKTIEGIDIVEVGGMPKYDHATNEQVIRETSSASLWSKLL